VPMPSGREILRKGDVLAVVGSRDAVDAARALISPGDSSRRDAIY
jgi:K+/H+ antiporter YhaU regulatory subunit KhtT